MQEFLNFVAEVFKIDPSEISMDTTYIEYEKWDSLMMLRLVMELEEEYDTEVPIDEVPNIKTINDLYQYTLK